jgi:CheY-like chemotaxis protein
MLKDRMSAKKVFIVDDALSDRTLLSVTFKKAGYRVYLAKNGIEAYMKFFKLKPDIVLVDILLPKMRGDTLIRWLKGTQPGKEIPFIVISGHTAMKEYLYQLGIEVFFEKPCKTKVVLEAAEELLKIYQGRRALEAQMNQLKTKFGKVQRAVTTEKHKICEVCQIMLPVTEIRCPHCNTLRLCLVETPDIPIPTGDFSGFSH